MLKAEALSTESYAVESISTVLMRAMEDQGAELRKKQDDEEVRRVWYLDTPELDLRNSGRVLRAMLMCLVRVLLRARPFQYS
jgi:hypothetical protein